VAFFNRLSRFVLGARRQFETERAEKIAVSLIGPGSIEILGFRISIDELCHVSLQVLAA
jgi:hypothetical protein